MLLFILYFSPASCYFLPLRPNQLPWHPTFAHPHPVFPLNVRLQVTHPYKTTSKVTVLYMFLFVFLYIERKENDLWPNGGQQAVCEWNLPLISSCIRFWFVRVVPKYLKYRHVL